MYIMDNTEFDDVIEQAVPTDQAVEQEEEFDLDLDIEVPEQGGTFKFKLGDEEFNLPEALKGKVIPQSEWTKKTQTLAQERKALEEAKAQLEAQRYNIKQADDETKKLESTLYAAEIKLATYEDIDWQAYLQQNPVEAQKHYIQYQQLKDARQTIAKSLTEREQARQEAYQSTSKEKLQKAKEELLQQIPSWDNVKESVVQNALTKYGFSKDDVEVASYDSRVAKMMIDAEKWNRYTALRDEKNGKTTLDHNKPIKSVGKPSSKTPSAENISDDAQWFKERYKR